ncbi:hypothetical protein CEUSTIGMA_g2378.t1 [Chlamydomonas eustigma]|uniref:ARID domain-containing protein n=1 Tax=Chlamydomonas eustigma TaxID=1157962 RepID=A0A250WWD1_9CHLO|nr:hypothetical protein CEUSTIGMA_g2378.t1 [Chlamydomonas eustigma]|eukprot:GAX74932.1 hypothetical protein CEUSTIGMA_g2378.t1 [Chlamydomonas eustigma]
MPSKNAKNQRPRGALPTSVDVQCGGYKGTLVISKGKVVLADGQELTPIEFERASGKSQTKKWRLSLRVCAPGEDWDNKPVGEWLQAHGVNIRSNFLSIVTNTAREDDITDVLNAQTNSAATKQDTVSFKASEMTMRSLSDYLDRVPCAVESAEPSPEPSLLLNVLGQSINPRKLLDLVRSKGGYMATCQNPCGWSDIAASLQLPERGSSPHLAALAVRSTYEASLLRYERQQLALAALSSSPLRPATAPPLIPISHQPDLSASQPDALISSKSGSRSTTPVQEGGNPVCKEGAQAITSVADSMLKACTLDLNNASSEPRALAATVPGHRTVTTCASWAVITAGQAVLVEPSPSLVHGSSLRKEETSAGRPTTLDSLSPGGYETRQPPSASVSFTPNRHGDALIIKPGAKGDSCNILQLGETDSLHAAWLAPEPAAGACSTKILDLAAPLQEEHDSAVLQAEEDGGRSNPLPKCEHLTKWHEGNESCKVKALFSSESVQVRGKAPKIHGSVSAGNMDTRYTCCNLQAAINGAAANNSLQGSNKTHHAGHSQDLHSLTSGGKGQQQHGMMSDNGLGVYSLLGALNGIEDFLTLMPPNAAVYNIDNDTFCSDKHLRSPSGMPHAITLARGSSGALSRAHTPTLAASQLLSYNEDIRSIMDEMAGRGSPLIPASDVLSLQPLDETEMEVVGNLFKNNELLLQHPMSSTTLSVPQPSPSQTFAHQTPAPEPSKAQIMLDLNKPREDDPPRQQELQSIFKEFKSQRRVSGARSLPSEGIQKMAGLSLEPNSPNSRKATQSPTPKQCRHYKNGTFFQSQLQYQLQDQRRLHKCLQKKLQMRRERVTDHLHYGVGSVEGSFDDMVTNLMQKGLLTNMHGVAMHANTGDGLFSCPMHFGENGEQHLSNLIEHPQVMSAMQKPVLPSQSSCRTLSLGSHFTPTMAPPLQTTKTDGSFSNSPFASVPYQQQWLTVPMNLSVIKTHKAMESGMENVLIGSVETPTGTPTGSMLHGLAKTCFPQQLRAPDPNTGFVLSPTHSSSSSFWRSGSGDGVACGKRSAASGTSAGMGLARSMASNKQARNMAQISPKSRQAEQVMEAELDCRDTLQPCQDINLPAVSAEAQSDVLNASPVLAMLKRQQQQQQQQLAELRAHQAQLQEMYQQQQEHLMAQLNSVPRYQRTDQSSNSADALSNDACEMSGRSQPQLTSPLQPGIVAHSDG